MSWLFSRRPTGPDGGALYAAVVGETRRADWYLGAEVPDTIDGRFAVLSTLLALLDIRLGKGGDAAKRAFEAMMPMKKIEVAAIEAAVRG